MRFFLRLIMLTLVLASPAGLWAQAAVPGPGTAAPGVGVFVGLGSGPSPSIVRGVEVRFPLTGAFALRGELSQWESGVGVACPAAWPDSYACGVEGWASMAGVVANTTLGRLAPYAELSGGRYVRGAVGEDRVRSPVLGLEAGTGVELASGWSTRIGGRIVRVFDGAYSDLMGDDLGYSMVVIGLAYRLGG